MSSGSRILTEEICYQLGRAASSSQRQWAIIRWAGCIVSCQHQGGWQVVCKKFIGRQSGRHTGNTPDFGCPMGLYPRQPCLWYRTHFSPHFELRTNKEKYGEHGHKVLWRIGSCLTCHNSVQDFFQKHCDGGVSWDDLLTGELLTSWNQLIPALQGMRVLVVPWCYLADVAGMPKSARLAGFCDASAKAYVAVAYLRMETEMSVCVRFLATKTHDVFCHLEVHVWPFCDWSFCQHCC